MPAVEVRSVKAKEPGRLVSTMFNGSLEIQSMGTGGKYESSYFVFEKQKKIHRR